MKKFTAIAIGAMLALSASTVVWATNGDNLIGVGASSRAMGGVGVARPQDMITTIFGNPAGLSFSPSCPQSESDFGGTVFDPSVNTRITTPGGVMRGDSAQKFFVIPAVGVSCGCGDRMRFGIGAYGVSGMGVDYRNKGFDLDGNPANGFEGDIYTKLEIMKFAPALSLSINDNFAVGASLQLDYGSLDLGSGSSHNYAIGAQVGALYRKENLSFGLSVDTPQKVKHERVANFDADLGDPYLDTLELESPWIFAGGVAYDITEKLLVEADVKRLQWADAKGYKDFDWDSQWVFAVGSKYQTTDKLALSAGFNYGKNPVNEHNGFNPMGRTSIQGESVSTFGYEMLRIVGFPAIVEAHATAGFSYRLANDLTINFAYMHGFKNSISETSAGNAINLKSELSENSYSFAMNWNF